MFIDDFVNLADFYPIESSTALQSDRIKPKLGDILIALHANVPGFIAIAGIKEESIRSNSYNCQHLPSFNTVILSPSCYDTQFA